MGDRQSCPIKVRSCRNRCPIPHRHNTFSRTYESDTESNTEDYKPRHFSLGSFEIHEHYNTTTGDEHSHLDTSSEDEHSLMDYENTPVLTYTEHIATTPPTPCPRPSRHAQYQHQDLQKSQARLQTAEKSPQDNVKNQFQHTHTHSQPWKHHCYLHHLYQLNNIQREHSFQGHHNATATDTSIIHTFLDHIMHQSITDNAHHYYPVNHRDQQSLKDSSICKYLYTCLCYS